MTDENTINEKLIDDALAILADAVLARPLAIYKGVNDFHKEHGPDGITTAMILWLDVTANAMGFPEDLEGKMVHLSFQSTETGEICDADQVPAVTAWAGRMFTARLNMDKEMFGALLRSIPQGEMTDYFFGLLGHVAQLTRTALCERYPASEAGTFLNSMRRDDPKDRPTWN
jgi:hypothetical protein